MKRFRGSILTFLLFLSFGVLFTLFKPLPGLKSTGTESISGHISGVNDQGGLGDILLQVEEDESTYYIDNGVSTGLDANSLNDKLKGKEVIIYYTNPWEFFNLSSKVRTISKITADDQVIYDSSED